MSELPSSSSMNDPLHGADPVLLNQMMEMGVNRNLAIKSLLFSGNKSIEAAFTWSSELSAEELEKISESPIEADEDEWVDVDGDENEKKMEKYPKMIFVINTELRMKPGKVAAQVGHAVLNLYRKVKSKGTRKQKGALGMWSDLGETMVVVKGNSAHHMKELKCKAEGIGIISHTVIDAGRTQVAEGSETVLGLFGYANELEEITAQLKLL